MGDPTANDFPYLHGFSPVEQERLVKQAATAKPAAAAAA